MNSKLILLQIGKACQVFPGFDALCQKYGEFTLGEIAEDKYDLGYFAISGAQGYWLEGGEE